MQGIFGVIAIVIVGALWFTLTVFILCIMEVRFLIKRAVVDTD